ncbi:glycosyltransferase family 4 protein [Dongia soli]|uniref:MraY family glycosyltransferase n=1 Tax=Dongia soli TaxID=600628 RepID=A0ABU5E8U8_9PROT|nr:MraY family glycosyltransferase [Dongia soli]MDY0882777.1 MraY family glycosyltransferase [Dongia soli]
MMILYLCMIGALFISLLCIPQLMAASDRLGLIDRPEERRVHVRSTPRSGGIGIALGALLPLLFLLPQLSRPVYAYILGALIIISFGVWDDRKNLDYRLKVLGQLLAIIVFVGAGYTVNRLPFMSPDSVFSWVSIPVTGLFMLAVTNAFNLHDGLDGLAAGSAIMSLGAIAIIGFSPDALTVSTLLAATVIGAAFGFLRYNTHPAVIFMGDAGSQFLGFTIAALAVLLCRQDVQLSPSCLLMLIGLPALDTATVMFQRLRAGRSPFSPDKNHIHHKLLAIGFRHNESVAIIYGIQAIFISGALLLQSASDWLVILVYLTISIGCLAGYHFLQATGWRPHRHPSPTSASQALRKTGKQSRLTAVLNFARLGAALATVLYILSGVALVPVARDLSIASLVIACLALIAVSLKSSLVEQVGRITAYIAATVVCYSLTYTQTSSEFWWLTLTACLFGLAFVISFTGWLLRDGGFQFNNLDFLIGIALLGIFLFPMHGDTETSFRNFALRLVPLLYCIEILLNAKSLARSSIWIGSIASLLLIGMKGVI